MLMWTTTMWVVAVLLSGAQALRAEEVSATMDETKYVFRALPYAYDALEPAIDAKTMEIHYSRHHLTYYNNFVALAKGADWNGRPLTEIFARIDELPVAVRNNGGGYYNHDLFWDSLSPNGGGEPTGDLAARLVCDFGSFPAFKKEFEKAALGQFGSGWAWLCVDENGRLFITATPNQDNPLMNVVEKRGIPLLMIDVWEHAYYLKYQNRRADYISAFWTIVNWDKVSERLAASKK